MRAVAMPPSRPHRCCLLLLPELCPLALPCSAMGSMMSALTTFSMELG